MRIRTRNRVRALSWLQYSDLRAMLPFYFQTSRLDEARMNRTGLIIALAIAVVAGLVFGVYPELDLRVARHFYRVVDSSKNAFAWRIYPPVMLARDIGLWIGALLAVPAIAALVIKLILPRRKLLMSGRAIVFLIATLALAPGLLVNVLLKDHWGRPRPIDVTQFGGDQHFVAWWDPRGDCPANCAFVSGDVAGAFWAMAPAALAPPQWRALAFGAALALGTGMAVIRVMAGGHFLSDVIFAGVFTFIVIWIMYALIYRWPRTRLSDAEVERAIERVALPSHDFIVSLFGGRPK
jgi:lipid A 4'-phosphatase